MERAWSWLPWTLKGVSLALYIPTLALLVLNRDASEIWLIFDPYAAVGMLVIILVGGYLASKRPGNLLGWFFLVIALIWQLSSLVAQYAVYGLETRPPLPWAAAALWVSLWLSAITLIALPTIPLLLFPSGRLDGRWEKMTASGIAIAIVILVGALMSGRVVPPGFPELFDRTPHPFSSGEALWNPVLGILIGGICGLIAISMLFYRFYMARGVARQQYKWVMLVMVLLVVVYIADFFARMLETGLHVVTDPMFALISGLIPVAMAVAILRYQLWDIDFIISRALIYGALSACVIAIYIVTVAWLGTVFRSGGGPILSLLATAIVAVLFQPLRVRIQGIVNQLLYGERDEPYAVISRLGRRLEDSFVPDAVLVTIVGTVREALRLPYAAIALNEGGQLAVAAAAGDPVEETIRLPLVYQQASVGELLVSPRSPGEEFSFADLRLLDDLARQAGIAAHSVALARELQSARERLVATREEERRRLRRDLHDGLGSQLAALHLHAGAVRHLVETEPELARHELDDLRAELREAIASIRELVHGLRPVAIDELGLLTALEERIRRMTSGQLAVAVEFPDQLPPLAAAVEVAIYRIVEEALTNVVSHSGAAHCRVTMHVNDMVNISIEDDGIGLESDQPLGVGQLSMRERAEELGGRFMIETQPGGGTRIDVQIPLVKRSANG